ncbi:hypothetical protein M8S83_15135, partial [Enterobacter asburiae]|uniref:hypothetical protein n=1 Tax=Enterobacter asburiae TaxID=61645 RepID=UPI002075F533
MMKNLRRKNLYVAMAFLSGMGSHSAYAIDINTPTTIDGQTFTDESINIIDNALAHGGSPDVAITNTTINNSLTSGIDGDGIVVDSPAPSDFGTVNLNIDTVKINTTGNGSTGLNIMSPGSNTVQLSNSEINSAGTGIRFSPVTEKNGTSLLDIFNSTVTADAGPALVTDFYNESTNAQNWVYIEDSTLTSNTDVIRANFLSVDPKSAMALEVSNSKIIAGDNNIALSFHTQASGNAGQFDANFSNSVIKGDVVNSGPGGVDFNMSLEDGSQWDGALIPKYAGVTSYVKMSGGSVWNVTANSRATGVTIYDATVNTQGDAALTANEIDIAGSGTLNGKVTGVGTMNLGFDTSSAPAVWNITGNSDVNTLVVDHSQMTSQNGATLTANNLTLRNGSVFTGILTGNTATAMTGGSVWNLSGNSKSGALALDGSKILSQNNATLTADSLNMKNRSALTGILTGATTMD